MGKNLLYTFIRCPYAIRARMALAYAGIPYERIEVDLKAKPAELYAVSPKATVPVLVLEDGTVIDQSLEIMHYALSQHDPEGWLAHDRTRMVALIAAIDGPFKHTLDRYKYPERYAEEGFTQTESRVRGEEILKLFGRELEHSSYLMGDSPSLADFATFPLIRQFAKVDLTWFAAALPAIQKWLDGMSETSFFAQAMLKS